jgi:endonuclease/exonuclease/phosphatase family metal-dependent hydrolase
MKALSWNLAGRLRCIPQQIEMLVSREPDLVALQEVRRPGLPLLRKLLRDSGLIHQVDSFELAPCPALLTGPRRYGLLIASRFPMCSWEPGHFDVPWPERMLSADIETPWGSVEVHTTHIPPGVTNGWIKIEMLEGLYAGLAHPSTTPRLLCGDFNTPQLERPTGEVVTWGQRLNRKGIAVIRQHMRGGEGVRWDRGERHVLQGLAAYDLHDVYRTLHGYATQAYSWCPYRKDPHRQARLMGRRFDHCFASGSLNPVSCMYLHGFRESGLSDHAALEVVFSPSPFDQ